MTTALPRSIALDNGDGGTGTNALGVYALADNVTNDGSAESIVATGNDFVGPITADADAGTGPGSGFKLTGAAFDGKGADFSCVFP